MLDLDFRYVFIKIFKTNLPSSMMQNIFKDLEGGCHSLAAVLNQYSQNDVQCTVTPFINNNTSWLSARVNHDLFNLVKDRQ